MGERLALIEQSYQVCPTIYVVVFPVPIFIAVDKLTDIVP
jgi:hypothetical protein